MKNDVYAFCPIIKQNIDEDTCTMTVFASDGTLPLDRAPRETTSVKDFGLYCATCTYNKDKEL